ncbi:hypothetical protein [Lewinella sp. LCG006]|uniref:hypothetical protein n=1 Tax=Lewinella sp. LCG006 TaxID=3231911 RepID=UPI00346071FB
MKTLSISLLTLLSAMLIIACVNPPDYPDTPVIKYLGINKMQINQGISSLPNDTLSIRFSFTDGDGDLSINDTTDVFLYDSRFPSLVNPYKIPTIPLDGTGNGIRGEITVNIRNNNQGICCIENGFPCPNNAQNPIDTFSYEIQIRDRAGNMSNRIRTETIDIICR